jgi:hypothetical protein
VLKKSGTLGLILGVLLLAACQQQGTALRQYTKGDEIASNDFSDPSSFEEGAYEGATLRVIDGVYQIDVMQGNNVLWWGQGGETYTDTVIDVDTEQRSEVNENVYGVMCRVSGSVGQEQTVDPTLAAIMQDSTPEATSETTPEATAEATAESTEAAATTDEATAEATSEATPLLTATPEPTFVPVSAGDGYLFVIQGSGAFAILRTHDRQLIPLVDLTPSEAINRGAARNRIRAICVGNYLALYVNDQFLGDATDDTYKEGQIGLGAGAANRLGTRIVFDNLTISTPVQQ